MSGRLSSFLCGTFVGIGLEQNYGKFPIVLDVLKTIRGEIDDLTKNDKKDEKKDINIKDKK